MFHGDGSVRVPGKCVQCAEESSDVEEDLCRTCLPDMHQSAVFGDSARPTSGAVQHWDSRKRVRPEDEDTTDEEFGAQPEDDDTTQEEELASFFEPPIPWVELQPPKNEECKTNIGKTTKKCAKGPKPTSKHAVFKALVQDMDALPPDCLAGPLVRSRSSAPPLVQLDIDLDVVVAAYAETQVAYKIYCDGLRTRLEALVPHVKSVTFHVLTDQLTLHKFPEFEANGLGAFTAWVPGAGMGHEGGLRLASFRLMYAAMLAKAYTHNDVNRPIMVPSSVKWVSTGAQRVVLVQDADETPGAQMLGLIAHGLKVHLSMCFLGTPPAANYHTPLIAQVLFFPPKCSLLQTQDGMDYTTTSVFYGHLYAALVRSMSETLEVKAACKGYAEDAVLMIKVLLDVQLQVMDLKEYRIGVASITWPQDESVTYVLAQSAVEHDFTQKPETALFYNNMAKLAWSREGSDRSLLSAHK